ncbi:SusC/RagA family TonB-linked outer membrane protein [Mangrovibacterium diazotrophicum]|nr:SusC/RagA family TonB-linked outer membrane protein [Mangrovibacterium diazotrophicum]
MKMTFLLTLGFVVSAFGNSFSQSAHLNLDFQQEKIADIIEQVENQSDYVFLYKEETFNVEKKLTFKIEDGTINDVLAEVTKGQGVSYEVFDRQVVITKNTSVPEMQQQVVRNVKGLVLDEYGEPVPGATVVLTGKSGGTVTDMKGEFSLSVPQDVTSLSVSFIGFTTSEVDISGKETVTIVLKENVVGVDEVLVVAYGTAKKESLTGAVAAIDSKTIEGRAVTNVSSILEGNAVGVQVNNTYGEPGSEPTIRIRGFSSVNGSNEPLYVLDGVPFGGNISDLNPQDIESISVLKDAASSALFGNRASNGVILITTKKGKSKGNAANLNLNINQGVFARGIKEYERLGADDFMEVMWKGYRNYLMSSQGDDYPTTELANAEATSTLVDTYLKYNIYNKANDALFDGEGNLVSDAKVLSGYDDLDWFDYIERLGYRQDYSVSGSGGTDVSNYYLSAGYLDEKGYVEYSDFKRFNGRANVSVTPRDWVDASLSIAGSHQISNNTTGDADNASLYINPFNYARNMAPIYPVYLHDMSTGEYLLDEEGNKQYDSGNEYSRPQNLGRHVIWENELNMDRTYRNTMQSAANMNIKFLKNFKFTLNGDLNLRNSENQTYNNATIGDGAGNNGRAKRVFYRYKNYTFQQQLSWARDFGLHHVDFLAGHENYSYNYSYTYGYKTTETFTGGTELNNFTDITSLTGYQNNYRTESYLSRGRYDYDGKYYFDASFRRDGSSRFKDGMRWGNFWSAGGGWIVSKEDFFSSISHVVDYLKLRASYGEVGNDASVDYYGYMALYEVSQNANLGAVYKSQNPADDIQWETSSSFGVALESRILDRIGLTVEYFDKRSKDLLFDVNLPLSAGATSTSDAEATVYQNLGSVSNRGVEFDVNIDLLKNRDLKWKLGINGTVLKNKIVKLPEQNKDGIINGTKRYLEGHGVYDFWMYQFVGVDQMTGMSLYEANLEDYTTETIPEDYLVQIGDDYYTTYTTYAKKDWSGSAIPDIFGSLSTSLNYKNFDFSVLCTYSLGGKTYDSSYRSLMSVGSTPSAVHKDVLKSWDGVPDGMTESSANRIDPNGVPIIDYGLSTYTNSESSRFLQDASYLVVKNVSLGYHFPKSITNKLDISNLAVNLSVENLATLTKLQGMNPQQSFSGINSNAFVTARVFSLGINVKL